MALGRLGQVWMPSEAETGVLGRPGGLGGRADAGWASLVQIAPEIHYAPTERLDRIDVGLIDNAGVSIEMAAYVLTDREVIDALDAAAARGVQARVILEPRERSAVDRMAGLDLRRKRPGPLQHLKAYVVDGAVMRTGSANFSHSGETAQDNDLIVIRDPAAVEGFEKNLTACGASPSRWRLRPRRACPTGDRRSSNSGGGGETPTPPSASCWPAPLERRASLTIGEPADDERAYVEKNDR